MDAVKGRKTDEVCDCPLEAFGETYALEDVSA